MVDIQIDSDAPVVVGVYPVVSYIVTYLGGQVAVL